jgi:hypothetical protein
MLWDITPCSLLIVYRRFGRTCRHHFQGRRTSKAETSLKAAAKDSKVWRWRRNIPPKCRFTYSGVHSVVSQKTWVYISTGLRTSRPRWRTGSRSVGFAERMREKGFQYLNFTDQCRLIRDGKLRASLTYTRSHCPLQIEINSRRARPWMPFILTL